MKTIIRFCRPYLKQIRSRLILFISLSVLMSLASMITPYLTGSFIDRLLSAENLSFLWRYGGLLCALAAVEFVLSYVCERLYVRVQIAGGYRLNAATICHVQNVPFRFMQDKNAAFINQQINNDANAAVIFCITFFQNIITNSLLLLIPILLIGSFSPWLGACMAVLNLLYFALYNVFRRSVYRADYAFMEEQAAFFSKLDGQLSSVKFIQTQGLSNSFIKRLDRSVRALLGKALKSQQAEYGFTGSDLLIKTAANIIVFLLGGKAVLDGQMTIGELAIVMSYFTMSLGATQYFFSLGKEIQSTRVSCDRLQAIFDEKEQTNGAQPVEDIQSVECRGVSFGYGEGRVLSDLNLRFEKGGVYAFVGENGAGKSTLINLLLGLFIDGYEGTVRYNGIPIEELDMRGIRRRLIGVSEQEPMLLEETLRFNLTFDDEAQIDPAELQTLCSLLHLDSFLASLPDGLDTRISEGTSNLSGGEKQKLSILRALLKHPKLLVLDEPTSALDRESRRDFIRYLHGSARDRIVFLSTHDEELLNICTETIRLSK